MEREREREREFSCDVNSQFGEEILSSPDGHLQSGRYITDYRIEGDSIFYTEGVKAGDNCNFNTGSCEHIGEKEHGTCYPQMSEELKKWFLDKEEGIPRGRAPDWPCPFYTGGFF